MRWGRELLYYIDRVRYCKYFTQANFVALRQKNLTVARFVQRLGYNNTHEYIQLIKKEQQNRRKQTEFKVSFDRHVPVLERADLNG